VSSKAKPRFPSHRAVPARPARNEQQVFAFGPFVFDVEEAHAIIRRAPRPKFQIDAEAWALNYGIAYIQSDGTTPADAPTLIRQADGFVTAHAMRADLGRPLIMARIDGLELVIDGIHRLYKAWHLGIEQLNAYHLTDGETSEILLQDRGVEP
jgi:hypothetical protein